MSTPWPNGESELIEIREAAKSQLWRKHNGELLEDIKKAVVKSNPPRTSREAGGENFTVV